MKNNKGFTLVEMLVVITLIVVLGASAGLSADFSLKKARRNEYKNTYFDLFSAVDFYSEMRSFSCADISVGCDVEISQLIDVGLVDESILSKINPIYKKGNVYFKSTSVFKVRKKNGQKAIWFSCVATDTIDGNCNKDECKISKDGIYNGNSFSATNTLDSFHSDNNWGKC